MPTNACCLMLTWGISAELAEKILQMRTWFELATRQGPSAPGLELTIISGHRTPEEQRQLEREGRPTAPVDVSTHTSCPATGADFRIRGRLNPPPALRLTFGQAAEISGLRWGGGSSRDQEGIPSDWNHVDLGPRHR